MNKEELLKDLGRVNISCSSEVKDLIVKWFSQYSIDRFPACGKILEVTEDGKLLLDNEELDESRDDLLEIFYQVRDRIISVTN